MMETTGIDFADPFDQEWLLVSAIRQAFGMARRGNITYAEAVALTREIAATLLPEDSPLVEAFEPRIVKLYRERAEVRSEIENREITPLGMIDLQIREYQEEVDRSAPGERPEIESQLSRLIRARRDLDVTRWTEAQAISRDANVPERELPISDKGQGYKEYRVSRERRLRVRVLHPDPPESRSGVDMIYETYWDRETENQESVLLVRIAALQYKMWDGKVLYTSRAPNLRRQMEKMRKMFCGEDLCKHPTTPGGDERYRLPHCSAFLRPTDRLQTRDAWQVTHAWHVPICVALEDLEPTNDGHEVLRSKQISCKSTTQDTFQELFNRSMLGSRWISPVKLAELYAKISIFDDLDRVVVHAQEYSPIYTPPRRRRRPVKRR
jgi:hypothetical protein